jgi:hypothetical protein
VLAGQQEEHVYGRFSDDQRATLQKLRLISPPGDQRCPPTKTC